MRVGRFRPDRLAAWLIAVMGSALIWRMGLKRLDRRSSRVRA